MCSGSQKGIVRGPKLGRASDLEAAVKAAWNKTIPKEQLKGLPAEIAPWMGGVCNKA